MTRFFSILAASSLLLFGVGCATSPDAQTRYMGSHPTYESGGNNPYQAEIAQQIAGEATGNYFIGRRYHKENYKFWGYIRKAKQPWRTGKLVVLNENTTLAPDRGGKLGRDDGVEYRLTGYFSGENIYEPSSNGFYPEFVLQSATLRTSSPLPIFKDGRPNDPSSNVIQRPQ